jgi:FdhE protein
LNKAAIGRRTREYVEVNPRLKEITKFYRDVFAVQKKLSQKIPDQLPHIEGGQVSYRLEQGRRLLEADELGLDLPALRQMMGGLGEVLKGREAGALDNLAKLLTEDLEDDGALQVLVEAFWRCKDSGVLDDLEKYPISSQLLYMLMHVSIAPFLWKKTSVLARKADLSQVPRGRCPVCGDLPIMGLLGEDGIRILECSLCGARWGFPRMMCPFCSSTDQSKLSYIFSEDDRSRRAYLCDQCTRYIKVSEAGNLRPEDVILPLEDLATVHLDHAAAERGYQRGCRTVFS